MTPHEIACAQALSIANVHLVHRRFVTDMVLAADNEPETVLSEGQSHFLTALVHRYRRSITNKALVQACAELLPGTQLALGVDA